jgi:hypothetical protein
MTESAELTTAKTSKLAVFALVLACLFFVPLLPLIGGVLGVIALVRISSHKLGGQGVAIGAIAVGFVVGLVFQGILAAIAIPAFMRYMHLAKTSEAKANIYAVRALVLEYVEEHKDFPPASDWTPPESCCKKPGYRCEVKDADWSASPWKDLGFKPTGPLRFQYRFERQPIEGGTRGIIEARADLECDGRETMLSLAGDKTDENSPIFGVLIETK